MGEDEMARIVWKRIKETFKSGFIFMSHQNPLKVASGYNF
jgi:hypothetical protein